MTSYLVYQQVGDIMLKDLALFFQQGLALPAPGRIEAFGKCNLF